MLWGHPEAGRGAGSICGLLPALTFWLWVSHAGLEHVLEFMYTAKLTLSPENVEDVLAVGSFLQMQEVVQACNTLRALSAPAGLEIPTVAGRALSRPWVRFPFLPPGLPQPWACRRGSRRLQPGPGSGSAAELPFGSFEEPTFSRVFVCRLSYKGGVLLLNAKLPVTAES